MKKILVAGGAGFLGRHLCHKLLKNGDHVISIDNYFSGSETNLKEFIGHPNFKNINHDVRDPLDLEINEIYNLACPASPVHYQKDPIFTTTTSIMGALNLLNLAKKNNAKILQASTSEVYGDPQIHPQSESYRGSVNPIGIRACYDEGKRCAETLFFDYWRQYEVKIKVVRIFNTYGPFMHPNDGRVVSNFIVQALQNKPITIYGEGLQTRSFCYVDDLIQAIILSMDTIDDFTGPVNIGNPSEFTILELAKTIIQMTNSKSMLEFNPLPSDDPKKRQPDISLAKEILKWAPKVRLEDGLKITVSYFSEKLKDSKGQFE